MIEVAKVRQNRESVESALSKRGIPAKEWLDELLHVDEDKRTVQTKAENLQHELNVLSKEIGQAFQSKEIEKADELKARSGSLKEEIKALSDQLADQEDALQSILHKIPNIPHDSVPSGQTEDDNEVVFEEGEDPELHTGAKPHWEVAHEHNIIDFELGVKITGAGFPVYRGKGAQLQRALINFFLKEASAQGYEEIQPPYLINERSGIGTGQLPDKDAQMYHTEMDHLYLIPTAEVPITNIYRDVILSESDFPIKNCGYSACFRREAGSYGKDVRGLNRLHQFDKVEVVQISHPDHSYEVLDSMVEYIKTLLQKLGLKYRILKLCGGDLGFTSALTYDFEVWSAAQERWLEVSSVSNFETYQANRLKLRYKDKEGKTHLAHTLNGSALALPRIVAAILENNQTESGVRIPDVLVPFTGFDQI